MKAIASWVLLSAALGANAHAKPMVHYATKIVTKTWEPLALEEVQKIVARSALMPITATGAMRLRASSFGELDKGDFTLRIQGRFIEEAERFSVYLTFGPGMRRDLPSFFASETSSPLGRKRRHVMQRLIEETAARAASRLMVVLAPQLESLRSKAPPPLLDAPKFPLDWGTVDVAAIASPSKDLRELLSMRQPDHLRLTAIRRVRGHAFDQPAARRALELCLLRDPSAKVRAACVQAIIPAARSHVPTQRVLLAAMRREVDDAVLSELAEVSGSFVGLSRLETIATWLQLVASNATPARSTERIARLLAKEGELPNLELAVAACLQQEALVYGKKLACAQLLLPNIPAERRPAVVWKYLERVRVYDSGEQQTFEAVVERTLGRPQAKRPATKAHAALVRLLLSIAERRSAGRARLTALRVASRHAPATPSTIRRLARLAYDPLLADRVPRMVVDVVRREMTLAAQALAALQQVQHKARFLPKPNHANPYEEIERAMSRLRSM